MKLPLNHPIWSRLYGPYGVPDVSDTLAQLETRWDDDVAYRLFWGELHHQYDLYPVTFAALPWLWEISPHSPDVLCFFSHVVRCAVAPWGTGPVRAGPRGKYRGLSLKSEDHAYPWLPVPARLTTADMKVLKALQDWFAGNSQQICDVCVEAIPQDDRAVAAMLVSGHVALAGGNTTAKAIEMWSNEHEIAEIFDDCPPVDAEIEIGRQTSEMIGARNTELAKFLDDYIRFRS